MRKKILNSVLFLCFLGGVIFSSASVHAAVWYVDAGAPGSDGTSWGTAFNNIQDAINACSSKWMICMGPTDQIWVKAGFYSLSNQINVNKYVAIYGGFNGTETSSSQRDWENNNTLVNGNNSVRCFYITAPAIIDGFNIRRGRASSSNGGGIYIDSSPVYCSMLDFYHVAKIRNCTINQNTAELDGGGIYDFESDPVITNCIFFGNSARCGGGMKNWQSSPVIEKCQFKANQSTAPGSWGGGAICSDYLCYGTITNCTFYLNTSNSYGGAIAYHMAYPLITNCTFSENEAVHSGGAIYTNTGGPRVKNCIFWDDTPDELLFNTSSTWPYVKYSDIKGGYAGTGSDNIDDDPEFVNPPIDLHLQPVSPCIDTGTNTGAPGEDMDGLLRPQDGDGDGTAVCDMGAYEVPEPEPPCEGDFTNDGDVDGSDLAVFAADFGRTDCDSGEECQGDFDGDNDVDGSDLAVFAADFGRTDCPVYPRIEEYSNSGCLPGSAIDSSGDQYPDWCDDPDEIEIFVEGHGIHVTHRNATYNCCTDDIKVSMSVEGNLLRLWEKEILTHPCYCLCCYDVKASIVGLLPGVYTLEYCWDDYGTGTECHIDEIVIP